MGGWALERGKQEGTVEGRPEGATGAGLAAARRFAKKVPFHVIKVGEQVEFGIASCRVRVWQLV